MAASGSPLGLVTDGITTVQNDNAQTLTDATSLVAFVAQNYPSSDDPNNAQLNQLADTVQADAQTGVADAQALTTVSAQPPAV